MKRTINITIICDTDEVFEELDESLDYFKDHLDNMEGNVGGFSYVVSIKKSKSPHNSEEEV